MNIFGNLKGKKLPGIRADEIQNTDLKQLTIFLSITLNICKN